MREIRFEVKDDALIKNTFISEMGGNTCKSEVVLTKEIFQKCYEKWINPQGTQESDVEKSCTNCKYLNKERICNPTACAVMGSEGHALWVRAESEE